MPDDLVERVAHELTGYIGSTCCHKTGGRSADPRCECRLLARAAIAVVLEEAAKVVDSMAEDLAREFEPSPSIAWVREKAAAIRAMIPQEPA